MISNPLASRAKRGFTLIELLVVISIIALLAAILFPVFGRARENGRRSSCQSNLKQIGIGVLQYLQDYDEKYPQAYYYKDDVNGDGGYVHISGMIQPYTKSFQVFVCSSDSAGGLAPTNFSTASDNRGGGIPTGQSPKVDADIDNQAPRLSYISNEAILGRKRKSNDLPRVAPLAAIDETSRLIMMTDMTNDPEAIGGESAASGTAFKTHRSTNAVKCGSGVYNSETVGCVDGTTELVAITPAEAETAIETGLGTGSVSGTQRISYVAKERHLGGNNYLFADGHVKWHRLSQTLASNNFLWGKKMYTNTGGGEVKRVAGGTQVD